MTGIIIDKKTGKWKWKSKKGAIYGKAGLTFSESGADWIAKYDGRIIAETPRKKNEEKPPRWFMQTARQYIKEKKLKKVI